MRDCPELFTYLLNKKSIMKKTLSLFLSLLVVLMAQAAFGKTAPGDFSIQKINPTAQKKNDPVPSAIFPPSTVTPLPENSAHTPPYNPTGKPDPFMPTSLSVEGREKKKVLPLEQFDVNEFELVGIVTGSGTQKAMVQDLTGKGYFLQIGTRIGKMGGKVIRITGKEVFIREPYYDFLGRRSSRVISLKLPQSQFGTM